MQQPPPPPPLPPQQQLEPPRAPPAGIPYAGSRISLISKTDIRYEGYLFNIDTRQSMVALQSVRSFGTEGRRAEHIPPSPQVLQYATFKASEIKDLHVSEAAPPPPSQPSYGYAQPPPLPPGPPQPPAPPQPMQLPPQAPRAPPSPPKPKVPQPMPTLLTPGSVSSAHQQQLQAAQAALPPVLTPEEEYKQNEQRADAILAQQSNYNESRRQQQNSTSNHNSSSGGPRTIPGMGGHLLKRKERRVPGGEQHEQTAAAATAQDFDFEERLTAFNKEEEFSKLSTEQPKTHYQKASFFDTISCDALDRLEGFKARMTGFEERKLNAETFGAVGLNNRRNFRGSRGGGRGGGRGGNRRRGGGGRGIGGLSQA